MKQEILKRIESKESLSNIARYFGVSRQYVHQLKKQRDITVPIKTFNKDEEEFLQDAYYNFMSDEFNVFFRQRFSCFVE